MTSGSAGPGAPPADGARRVGFPATTGVGLSEINRRADPAHRAEAVSPYFAAAYVGLGLPIVLVGVISVAVATVEASAWVAGAVAVLILAAVVVVARVFGTTTTTPLPPSCDSWCNPRPAGEAPTRSPSRSAAR